MGTNITGKDSQYSYVFSPVNNLASKYMLRQYSLNGKATGLSIRVKVDGIIRINPEISFNKDDNIIWTFEYSSNVSIQYICDPQAKTISPYMEFTNILEIIPGKYLFQVSSSFFCSGNIAPILLSKNQCIWNDSSSSLFTLNLTSLYGKEIIFGSARYPYKYSICGDMIYVNGGTNADMADLCCMVGYWESDFGSEYLYNYWDSSILPTYNSTDNSWTFLYPCQIKNSCNNLKIIWICDPTIDPYNVVDFQPPSGYVKSVTIKSKYACNDVCYFTSNDGKYSLDLHSLSGETIYETNDDSTYSIEYTPCSNYVQCNNKDVMAMRWNIENRECDPYLAVFAGNNFSGYNLSYDTINEQYHFAYYNGDTCAEDGSDDIFNIYWKCNKIVLSWKVTKVETINECEYAMYIETNKIC
eukprot:335714_1